MLLHQIEVDVIDVTLEVSVVADCMLPEPSLPDSCFAPLHLAPRLLTRAENAFRNIVGNMRALEMRLHWHFFRFRRKLPSSRTLLSVAE